MKEKSTFETLGDRMKHYEKQYEMEIYKDISTNYHFNKNGVIEDINITGNVNALAKIGDIDGIHLDYVRLPDVILAEAYLLNLLEHIY